MGDELGTDELGVLDGLLDGVEVFFASSTQPFMPSSSTWNQQQLAALQIVSFSGCSKQSETYISHASTYFIEGESDGDADGSALGLADGSDDGDALGVEDGTEVGDSDGE